MPRDWSQDTNNSKTTGTYMYVDPKSATARQSVCPGDSSYWVQPVGNVPNTASNYEASITSFIHAAIAARPIKPNRPGVNPFLMYTKDKWHECKLSCSTATSVAGRDVIRQTLGRWWKQAPDDVKQPYVARSQAAQEQADASRKEWERAAMQWDKDAARLRAEYIASHPVDEKPQSGVVDESVAGDGGGAENLGVSKRRTNVSNNVVLDHL